jgi:hypothetical protein
LHSHHQKSAAETRFCPPIAWARCLGAAVDCQDDPFAGQLNQSHFLLSRYFRRKFQREFPTMSSSGAKIQAGFAFNYGTTNLHP